MASSGSGQGLNLKVPILTGAEIVEFGGWTIHELKSVNSTNLVAASLPLWHAVRAETQTAGRGRFERAWVSDKGGLWLSAVVPAPLNANVKEGVPLVAGLAVCTALSEFGIQSLRMRWPNDVLVRDRKLAGLLVDQFVPDRLVIGIGINVSNQPETQDAKLKNQTARLAELVSSTPPLTKIAQSVLGKLYDLVVELSDRGFSAILPRINALWGEPHRVELALDGGLVRGIFTSVDQNGRLLLRGRSDSVAAYKPTQVRHLQEIA